MKSPNKDINLWQITNEYQNLLLQLYDSETGEVNELIDAKINQLFPDVEQKCIAFTHWIKKQESDFEQLKKLKCDVEERLIAYNKYIDKLKSNLLSSMEKSNIKEISCPYFKINLRMNPYSTQILNDREIPTEFINVTEKVIVDIKPDKNKIKDYVLKTGNQIPGAYVTQTKKVEIKIDKI